MGRNIWSSAAMSWMAGVMRGGGREGGMEAGMMGKGRGGVDKGIYG